MAGRRAAMLRYDPVRDGYPSMFEVDDVGSGIEPELHQPLICRPESRHPARPMANVFARLVRCIAGGEVKRKPAVVYDGNVVLLEISQQTGGVTGKLVVLTAVLALVMLTVATIGSLTTVAPTPAPGQAVGISPEKIQRQTDVNGLPVTVVDQPY
jgi:hypothetical protein